MKLIFLYLLISFFLMSCSFGDKFKDNTKINSIPSTTMPGITNAEFATNDLNFSLLDENGDAQTMSYFKTYDFIVVVAYSPLCSHTSSIQNIRYGKNLKSKTFHVLSGLDPKRNPSIYSKKVSPLLFDRTDAISRSFNFKSADDFVILNPSNMQIIKQGNLKDRNIFIQKNKDGLLTIKESKLASNPNRACEIQYQPVSDFSDVGKSLSRSCVFCHSGKDNIELFNSEEQITHWQPMMLKTLRMGRMPAQADNELLPLYYTASPNDLKKITYWLASGANMTPQISKEMSEDKEQYFEYIKKFKAHIGKPSFILQAPTVHIPAKGLGFERLYKFDNKVDDDLYVIATNLETNLKATHHAHLHATQKEIPDSIFQDDKSGAMSAASTWGIDKKEIPTFINTKKEKGYVLNDQTVASYFKRSGFRFIPGFVTKIPKGSHLSIETHYDPTGIETTDDLRMEVYTIKDPVKKSHILKKITFLPDFKSFKIMPNQKNYKVVMTYTTEKEMNLHSYLVHLHYRGKSARLKAIFPGQKDEQILISFPRVQFKTYQGANFEKSILLPKGTKLISEVIYDNSDDFEANPNSKNVVVLGRSAYFNESHLPRLFYYENSDD